LPHTFKDLTTALLRQVEVEQEQMGASDGGVPVHVLYEIHSLFAIVKYAQIKLQTRLL
jgi:hypothetical protein